jgi:small conductance mechanosensitive channel
VKGGIRREFPFTFHVSLFTLIPFGMITPQRWPLALLVIGLLTVATPLRAQVESTTASTAAADALAPDSLPPEPVSDQRAEQDELIRNALQAVFDRVPGLTRVDVVVDAGVVRLVGSVLNGDTRRRAVQLASETEGVVFVDDRITESTSLEEQLQPTWDRLQGMGYGVVAKLPLLAVALLIVILAFWLGARLASWGGPAFLTTRNPFLQGLIRRFVQSLVVVVGIILALDLLDATALVGALVGTAGLAGLAIGFAFKDIVENYLAGTILALRQPFAKNDHIRVDQFEGKVVRLTPRETILMSLDGNHIRLPNALIFRSPLVNFTRNPLRRFAFMLGLGTNDDLVQARRVAVHALVVMDGVLNDPAPQAIVMDVGDSTVTVEVSGWIDQSKVDWSRARGEAIRLVKTALEDAGLTLPSPEFLLRTEADAPVMTPPSAELLASDVAVDRTLDAQIEVDRHVSDEDDLLDAK